MKRRCLDVSDKDYGGRGIRVCDRWADSFPAFVMDMGRRPSSDHSIDRIDVDGHYEPSNCRWATRKEQMNNLRKTRKVLYRGEVVSLRTACESEGIRSDRSSLAVIRRFRSGVFAPSGVS